MNKVFVSSERFFCKWRDRLGHHSRIHVAFSIFSLSSSLSSNLLPWLNQVGSSGCCCDSKKDKQQWLKTISLSKLIGQHANHNTSCRLKYNSRGQEISTIRRSIGSTNRWACRSDTQCSRWVQRAEICIMSDYLIRHVGLGSRPHQVLCGALHISNCLQSEDQYHSVSNRLKIFLQAYFDELEDRTV